MRIGGCVAFDSMFGPHLTLLCQTFTVVAMVLFTCLANVGMLNILIAQVSIIPIQVHHLSGPDMIKGYRNQENESLNQPLHDNNAGMGSALMPRSEGKKTCFMGEPSFCLQVLELSLQKVESSVLLALIDLFPSFPSLTGNHSARARSCRFLSRPSLGIPAPSQWPTAPRYASGLLRNADIFICWSPSPIMLNVLFLVAVA
jgi:hypothetical protein